MKKALIAVVIAAVMTLSGCASDSSNGNSTSQNSVKSDSGEQNYGSTENKELEEISVVLDWYPNAVHAFIYTAIEKGYYTEEGLDVKILFPSNSNDAISLTAAGKADIGLYYQEDTIMAKVNEGIPVKSIGTIIQEPVSVIAPMADKNISSPKDLEGKVVGYSSTVFGEKAVETIVKNVGADLNKVNLIDVGFDLMTSMTTGNVDATYGCFINHEIPQMEYEGFQVNHFFLTDYGVPRYYALMFLAGESNLEKRADDYAKFLSASKKGFDYMKENPDEALKILLENQEKENFPLTEDVESMSMEILLPMMEYEDTPFLTQDISVWEENIKWLNEVGITDKIVDASEMFAELDY